MRTVGFLRLLLSAKVTRNVEITSGVRSGAAQFLRYKCLVRIDQGRAVCWGALAYSSDVVERLLEVRGSIARCDCCT